MTLRAIDKEGNADVERREFVVKFQGNQGKPPEFTEIDFDAPEYLGEYGDIFIALKDKNSDLRKIGWYLEGTIKPNIAETGSIPSDDFSISRSITGETKFCSKKEVGYCTLKSSIVLDSSYKPGTYTVVFFGEDSKGNITDCLLYTSRAHET